MTRGQFLLGTLPGLAALLLGLGLARFGYTPLIPALIGANWLSQSEAVYLGAANLAGYLAGSLLAAGLARRYSNALLVRGAMLAGSLSFAACGLDAGFWWFMPWRLLAGFIGGLLMVMAVPLTLSRIPVQRRGRAVGVAFTGVGIGVALSGTLVPLLAGRDVALVWHAMAATGFALTALTWKSWPAAMPLAEGAVPATGKAAAMPVTLLVAYALDGFSFVPHSLFWVDYIARGLGQGLASGGSYWALVGLGALCGPMLGGLLAEKLGFGPALLAAFCLKTVCMALPLLGGAPVFLVISSLVVGALMPGISALTSGRVAELVGLDRHRLVWGWMTTVFAAMQAAGGYLMSYIFSQTQSYAILFALATGALVLGAALVALNQRTPRGGI